ncbi:MAG: tetratricopeptide repeat protein [Deltaproteobacteria bacterium]|nr:tetratricopeptide repeat protein [Deltaproteobacteria bacterium]
MEIASAYFAMGEISNRERRYEKAKEALNRCIALAEKDKDSKEILQSAFMELGNSHNNEGRHRQAIRSFQRGLDLGYGPDKKDYWESKFRLALSYQGAGEHLKAENVLSEILEEGDPMLRQKVEVKLGVIGLEKELQRLSIWQEARE